MTTRESIRIGGTKGHIEEFVNDPIFIAIHGHFRWKMIPNCTGRYTCRDHKAVSHLTPTQLFEAAGLSEVGSLRQYHVTFAEERRKDSIYVVPFASDGKTGLISYIKHHDDVGDGGCSISYVHTLNSASGFQRKLEAMGVVLSDKDLVNEAA